MPYGAYPNYMFTMFAFLGFVTCCIPFPWHFKSRNIGTCLYMIWTGLACLNQFINSIVWNDGAINRAPIWCDISARFIIGVAVAIPACSLCINRQIYRISSLKPLNEAQQRRANIIDLTIGVGIPVLEMILQYIPQGHRFNILQEVGCFPFTYATPVAIVLVSLPPLIIGCVSSVYSIINIRTFCRFRSRLPKSFSRSNPNATRYLPLICLASMDAFFTVPLSAAALYFNCIVVAPWLGWDDTHAGFSRVDQLPSVVWRFSPRTEIPIDMSRWLNVACAFTFFVLFGFSGEARERYRSAYRAITNNTKSPIGAPEKPVAHNNEKELPLHFHHSISSSTISDTLYPFPQNNQSTVSFSLIPSLRRQTFGGFPSIQHPLADNIIAYPKPTLDTRRWTM